MLGIFRRRKPPERVTTGFRWYDERIFANAETASYRAVMGKGCYGISIRKAGYFAWETASLNRSFDDFVLEAEIGIDAANRHSAAGFMLRYIDQENFYVFLVSNKGMYRFDLLFNNHPIPLIEWTPLPEASRENGQPVSESFELKAIVHGTHFSFYADDEWIGEIENESLGSGAVGLAGQNFNEADTAGFRFGSFRLESRPLAVEREYTRWVHFIPHPPASRLSLAETFFTSGSFSAAAVQLRRALKGRSGTAREHFLLAECYMRLSMHDTALVHIEETLSREPENREALLDKANLLYLTNVLQARDFVRACITAGTLEPSPVLWTILGNSEYSLGNWIKSAEAYARAVEIQPDAPLTLKNAARSLEMAGQKAEALAMYLRAARFLFREDAYNELSLIMSRIFVLDPLNAEAQGMEAKMLYSEGKRDEALERLSKLVDAGSPDSAIHYLKGVILSEKGDREAALRLFQKAAEMEPEFALYQFRLAETRHLLGMDPSEALARACALDPEDPWINNLRGLLALEAGETEKAAAALAAALSKAPGEIDILLNLSEAYARSGESEKAMKLLNGGSRAEAEEARLANARGNILVNRGDFGGAVAEYEKAIHMDAGNPVYKENCASACLEVDMVHRAEELLSILQKSAPSVSVYNLLGTTAVRKGEYQRAELSYTAGLVLEPANPEISASLAMLHLERGRYPMAKELLEEVLDKHPGHAGTVALVERLRARYEIQLACSMCGRKWWVPRDLPLQPPLTVKGELPVEAPAGRCPKCGKLYCISCASASLVDMRFHCVDCAEPLKLSDNGLRYLVNGYVEGRNTLLSTS